MIHKLLAGLLIASTMIVAFPQGTDENLRTQVGAAIAANEQAQAAITVEEARLAEIRRQYDAQAILLRDARAAAQFTEEQAATILQEYLASITIPPPTEGRPGEDLDWGVRPKPTDAELDWIAEGGAFTSRRGLGTLTTGFGDAYRMSRASGDEDVVFGVRDAAGRAWVGGLYGQQGSMELAYPGDEKASATFVGLTETASISLVFGTHLTSAMPTGNVMAFDIGLRGPSDSFVIRANGGSDHVQLDGCWFLHRDPNHDYSQRAYSSGMHVDKWDTMVLRNHKWRGETPGSPGLKIDQHIFYLKGGKTSTLIENCNLFGPNRTGFQRRPDIQGQVVPTDRFMVRGNYSDGHGTNWEWQEGGAVITLWVSNGGTYIYDNVATNFRYQALVISGQVSGANFHHLASGNQHDRVYISGNRFTPGPATERGTVSISSVDRLHLWDDNEFQGPIVLDSPWNFERNGTLNGATTIHGETDPDWNLYRYDPATARQRLMTPVEVAALRN